MTTHLAAPLTEEKMRTLGDLLEQAQKSSAVHKKCLIATRKLRKEMGLEAFVDELLSYIYRVLVVFQKSPHVERVVSFIIALAGEVGEEAGRDDPLAVLLIEKLLPYHGARDKAVRYRVCQFTSGLLNSLGEDAEVGEDTFDSIEEAMIVRVRDALPAVRAHAVHALSRLQDPTDPEDEVVQEFLRILATDVSKEVRKAVLTCLGISQYTLPHVLARTRDVSEDVRKHAFTAVSFKIELKALTIVQRIKLLRDGLNDRQPIVRQACIDLLCKNWLKKKGDDPIQLLEALDCEGNEEETGLSAKHIVEHIWNSKTSVEDFIENVQAWVGDLNSMTVERVVFYRYLIVFLMNNESSDAILEQILPSVTAFCAVVESHKVQPYVPTLSQLFQLCREFDYSDEASRQCLIEMCRNTLKSPEISSDLIPAVMGCFVEVLQDQSEAEKETMELIEHVTQSSATIEANTLRRLSLLHELFALTTVSPTQILLREQEEFIATMTRDTNSIIRLSAVKTLGLFCMLDGAMARKHAMLFLNVLSNDQESVQIAAGKALFDIILVFGLNVLVEQGSNDDNVMSSLDLLLSCIESDSQEMRTIAAEGIAKLIFGGVIGGPRLLCRLFVLFFDPLTHEDHRVRQCLSVFFPAFSFRSRANQRVVAASVLPLIRILSFAPADSPLRTVSELDVARYLCYLSNPLANVATEDTQNTADTAHEGLALQLLREIAAAPFDRTSVICSKMLSMLSIERDVEEENDTGATLKSLIFVCDQALTALTEASKQKRTKHTGSGMAAINATKLKSVNSAVTKFRSNIELFVVDAGELNEENIVRLGEENLAHAQARQSATRSNEQEEKEKVESVIRKSTRTRRHVLYRATEKIEHDLNDIEEESDREEGIGDEEILKAEILKDILADST